MGSTEPSNLPEIWPSMIEAKDIQNASLTEETKFRWVYKMAGMRFEGISEIQSLFRTSEL